MILACIPPPISPRLHIVHPVCQSANKADQATGCLNFCCRVWTASSNPCVVKLRSPDQHWACQTGPAALRCSLPPTQGSQTHRHISPSVFMSLLCATPVLSLDCQRPEGRLTSCHFGKSHPEVKRRINLLSTGDMLNRRKEL